MPPLPLQVDNVFGCAMGLSYVIVTILIFTLQVRMPAASACLAAKLALMCGTRQWLAQ